MCNTAFVEVHEILEGIFLAQKKEETANGNFYTTRGTHITHTLIF
jgi:hypothetical protein